MLDPSIEDILRGLTADQATVLYWKCEGLNYDNISSETGWGYDSVTREMSFVYDKLRIKLGIDKDTHWKKRKHALMQEVRPILLKLINNDPNKLKDFPLIPTDTKEEPVVKPEIMALVLQDETVPKEDGVETVEGELVDEEKPEAPKEPPKEPIRGEVVAPTRRINPLWIALGAGGICLCLAAICAVSRLPIFQPRPTPTDTVIPSATFSVMLTQPKPNYPTDTPTSTFTPTSTLTLTPTSTFTSTPSNTPSPTPDLNQIANPFDLTKGQFIRNDNVSLKFINYKFYDGYDRIAHAEAAVSYWFELTNLTDQQILLIIPWGGLTVTTSTGEEIICEQEIGVYTVKEINYKVEPHTTFQILARCGRWVKLSSDTQFLTLKVQSLASLPESTWKVELIR